MKERYRRMFASTAAVVAVSRVMCDRLVDLGADPDQVHCIPCGIDPEKFRGAQPETAPPSFLSVGRFVEKKAPLLTLRAFATVQGVCRDAKLLMVGEGPLLAQARELAAKLGIAGAVRFLGACPHDAVRTEMRRARCFVQHSVVAPNGDTEGTPVAILEASASGLPVIATRHAGIPDVIVDGTTGFLVEEGDVEGMAGYMVKIAKDAPLAGALGRAARRKVIQEFSVERSIGDLRAVLQRASQKPPTDPPSYSRHPR
jgi:glycosyltransferase involved in cell wall biosynthesis